MLSIPSPTPPPKKSVLWHWMRALERNLLRNPYTLMIFCNISPLNHVWLFVTPWTVTSQSPLSLGFFRQEYWSELPFPPPGNLSHSGIEPMTSASPSLPEDSLPAESLGRPILHNSFKLFMHVSDQSTNGHLSHWTSWWLEPHLFCLPLYLPGT